MNRKNKIFPQMKEMKGLQVVIYCFINATLPYNILTPQISLTLNKEIFYQMESGMKGRGLPANKISSRDGHSHNFFNRLIGWVKAPKGAFKLLLINHQTFTPAPSPPLVPYHHVESKSKKTFLSIISKTN